MTAKTAGDGAHRRVLIIKLGALGDFFLAQTAFEALRAHHANDRLCLLTLPQLVDSARRSGLFDEIHVDPRDRSPLTWWRIRRLLLSGFDRIYDLQGQKRTVRYFQMMFPGPRPEWAGPVEGASHPDCYPGRKLVSTVERYERQLAALGIRMNKVPNLGWLDGAVDHLEPPERPVILVPGSSARWPEKRWPAAKYGALANILIERGLHPVVVGGPDVAPIAREILAICPGAVDFSGRTSLLELAGLARRARAAVGNDTGPTHVVGAVGTPTLILFNDRGQPINSIGARTRVFFRTTFDMMPVADVVAEADRLMADFDGCLR